MASNNASRSTPGSGTFKDAQVPAEQKEETKRTEETAKDRKETPESDVPVAERPETDPTVPADPEESFIVHREQKTDSEGNPVEKVHGPMPVSEYPTYAKENKL